MFGIILLPSGVEKGTESDNGPSPALVLPLTLYEY